MSTMISVLDSMVRRVNAESSDMVTDSSRPLSRPLSLEPLADILRESASAPVLNGVLNPYELPEEQMRPIQSAPDDRDQIDDRDDSPSSSDNNDCKKLARPNRDPMSHRIIEKRRRDRMNNCLTNLSKLIPQAYLKKGRGRIEKTEIIEMAIRYMRHMQTERKQLASGLSFKEEIMKDKAVGTDSVTQPTDMKSSPLDLQIPAHVLTDRYKQGFNDCIAETLRFLSIADGLVMNESTRNRLLMHLNEYFRSTTYDTLSGSFTDMFHPLPPKPSLVWPQSPQVKYQPLTYDNRDSVTNAQRGVSPPKDEPLNMSLKRPRIDQSKPSATMGQCSQLREILAEAKEADTSCSENAAVPKRPHVFRYTTNNGFPDTPTHPASLLLAAAADRSHAVPPQLSSGGSSGSTHYPSSPGSSSRSSYTGSYAGESPPRVVSPALAANSVTGHQAAQGGVGIPIFALHPTGMYYIPLTINAASLAPAAIAQLTSSPATGNTSCHPITITVNFSATSAPSTPKNGLLKQPEMVISSNNEAIPKY